MNQGTLAALVAASIVLAHGPVVQAATESRTFARSSDGAAVAKRSDVPTPVADLRGAAVERADTIAAAEGRAASTTAGTKRHEHPLRGSEAFVLLGMGVVLVGVLARQKRGFRRSETILLR